MSSEIHKKRPSRSQRFVRLLKSVVDPRALAHGFKIINYYNHTHVAELAQVQRGTAVNISPTASFGNGRNIILGDRARIGAGCSIWAGNGSAKITIGDDTMLAPNVMITASNYRFGDGSPINLQPMDEHDVHIGRDVWLAYGAVVLPGTTIGDGAIIGAGAVVRGNIPPNAIIAAATPTQIGQRFIAETDATALSLGAPNTAVDTFVHAALPAVPTASFDIKVTEAGIDSFDLITLRTRLETQFATTIPDREWSGIDRLADICRLPSLAAKTVVQTPAAHAPATQPSTPKAPAALNNAAASDAVVSAHPIGQSARRWPLNMPQMALSGLSESWLFKELGDIHWEMICNFLQTPSSAIADEAGDRLYATFTRLCLEVEPNLQGFKENQTLDLTSKLSRFGSSFFFGDHALNASGHGGATAQCRARTMSTFSKYGERGSNTSLIKGTPSLPQPDALPSLADFPEFGQAYRQRRSEVPETVLFECPYEILPSHDINGVGLLYFAAYPTIFDLCIEQYEGKGFLLNASTTLKDVLYYANSEPTETLRFCLHSQTQKGNRKRYHCSLYRSSDGKRMAEAEIEKQIIS